MDTSKCIADGHAQIAMEAEDVAEERLRAEDPDPLNADSCIILQGLSKRYPAEVRLHHVQLGQLYRMLP